MTRASLAANARRLLVVAGWLWVAVSIGVLIVFGSLRALDSLRPVALLDEFGRR